MSPITRAIRRAFGALSLALLLVCSGFADDAAYKQSVEAWRARYVADLTSDHGWLTVAGLFWLKDGQNRFGSDASNDIVLPPSAPAQAGVFEYKDGKVTVHIAPGVSATLAGKPLQAADLQIDSKTDRVVLGDLTLYIHASGPRLAVRLLDKNSKFRRNFQGLDWFPIDPKYRQTATFVPYPEPKQLDTENILGDPIHLPAVGYVAFSLNGNPVRLEAAANQGGTLFIVFRDTTAGKETYPASRFLETGLPKDSQNGKTVEIDFNEAYNPPCAYNPFTTCPLPVPGNRLSFPVPAGEKLYRHPRGT